MHPVIHVAEYFSELFTWLRVELDKLLKHEISYKMSGKL